MPDSAQPRSSDRFEENLRRLENENDIFDSLIDRSGPQSVGAGGVREENVFTESNEQFVATSGSIKKLNRLQRLAECLRMANEDFGDRKGVVGGSIRNQCEQLVHALEGISRGSDESPRLGVIEFCQQAENTLSYILKLYRRDPHGSFDEVHPDKVQQLLYTFRDALASERADTSEADARRAKAAAEGAEESLRIAQRTAGFVADVEIGKYYRDMARSEGRDALIFRVLAVVVFVVAFFVGWHAVQDALSHNQEGIEGEILRLIGTVPIIFGALYLAHESTGHRSVSRRAQEFHIRLQTLEAFTNALGNDEDLKAQLRAKVGESILTGPAALDAKAGGKILDPQKVVDRLIATLGERESAS